MEKAIKKEKVTEKEKNIKTNSIMFYIYKKCPKSSYSFWAFLFITVEFNLFLDNYYSPDSHQPLNRSGQSPPI